MSLAALPVYPAQDILLVDLGERWARGEFDFVQFAPSQSDGTRVFVKLKDGGPGQFLWFRVTDLSSFSISRVGQTLVTIAAGASSGIANDTISPTLNDATLANWRIIGACRQGTLVTFLASFTLTSTSAIQVRAQRGGVPGANSNTTGVTVGAGGDLIDVDVITLNPHGSDVGVGPHGHTIAAHPIVDPGHIHTLGYTGAAQVVVTVDWMIVHK